MGARDALGVAMAMAPAPPLLPPMLPVLVAVALVVVDPPPRMASMEARIPSEWVVVVGGAASGCVGAATAATAAEGAATGARVGSGVGGAMLKVPRAWGGSAASEPPTPLTAPSTPLLLLPLPVPLPLLLLLYTTAYMASVAARERGVGGTVL